MKLGDCFPEDERKAHLRSILAPGSILLLDCYFTKPPKPKFCILLCLEPEPVMVLVNSKISKFLEDRPALRDCQVLLHSTHHQFLKHDSYIDCTQSLKVSIEEIESQILKDVKKIKGRIFQDEKEAIVYAISTAKTIPMRDKEWVLKALSDPNAAL